MSDCNVCVFFDGDEAEFFYAHNVQGRKDCRCSECDLLITSGTIHQRARMRNEGIWSTHRTCLVCAEIRRAFCCHIEMYGGVFWEHMTELFEEIEVSGDCLGKLKTPEAKRYFAQRYREWKEATA